MTHRSTVALLISTILCSACFCSLPFASGVIWYDLYVYSDFGTPTLNPAGASYVEGTVVTVTFTELIFPETAYTRFRYDGVVGYGEGSYTGEDASFQVTMNSEISEQVDWQIQYQVEFETDGISGDTGVATVVTVDGVGKIAAELPFVAWYDSGAIIAFTYSSPVSGIYVLIGMTVSRTDASGHLFTESTSGSYTVSTSASYTTITGLYTVTSTSTTSATTSATATSSVTTSGSGMPYTSTTHTATSSSWASSSWGASTSTPSLPVFPSLPDLEGFLRGLWSSGPGVTGLGATGGSSSFGQLLNGSYYGVPNMLILLFFVIGLFILFVARKKRRES